jgi:hypothetical protein
MTNDDLNYMLNYEKLGFNLPAKEFVRQAGDLHRNLQNVFKSLH